MKFDSAVHRRRSIRLQGYDYSRAGAYFVTICTQHRECLFGDIVGAGPCACPNYHARPSTAGSCPAMRLNDAGKMVQTVWNEIPVHYPGIEIDEFVIMPNHIHGIVVIVGQGHAGLSLPDVVHRFKTMATKRYADGVKQNGWTPFSGRLWQRNYWEHIIRNESELNRIREYIRNNPAQWESDRLYGQAAGPSHAIREAYAGYSTEAWAV